MEGVQLRRSSVGLASHVAVVAALVLGLVPLAGPLPVAHATSTFSVTSTVDAVDAHPTEKDRWWQFKTGRSQKRLEAFLRASGLS